MEILLRQPVINLLHENGQFLLRYSKKNEIFVDFRDGNALNNDNASRRGSIDFFTDFSKMLELEVSKNWPILSSNYGGVARLLLYTVKTRFYERNKYLNHSIEVFKLPEKMEKIVKLDTLIQDRSLNIISHFDSIFIPTSEFQTS